jgi:hypothetical protein
MDMNEALANITGITRGNLPARISRLFHRTSKARAVYQGGFAGALWLILRSRCVIKWNLSDVLFNGSIYKDDSEMFWVW